MGKVVHGHRQAAAPSVGMACFASVGGTENKGASSELHCRRQMERTVVLRPANEQNERQNEPGQELPALACRRL